MSCSCFQLIIGRSQLLHTLFCLVLWDWLEVFFWMCVDHCLYFVLCKCCYVCLFLLCMTLCLLLTSFVLCSLGLIVFFVYMAIMVFRQLYSFCILWLNLGHNSESKVCGLCPFHHTIIKNNPGL